MKAVVIDDNEEILEIVKEYLEMCEVTSVSIINSPSKVAFEHDFEGVDLVICDVNMPFINGIELYDQFINLLKSGASQAKFFFLTGVPLRNLNLEEIQQMQLADEILIKPLQLKHFKGILKKHYLFHEQARMLMEAKFEEDCA